MLVDVGAAVKQGSEINMKDFALVVLALGSVSVALAAVLKRPAVHVTVSLEELTEEDDDDVLAPDYLFGDVEIDESDWKTLDDLDFETPQD